MEEEDPNQQTETDAEEQENSDEEQPPDDRSANQMAHDILNEGLDYENSILQVMKVRKNRVNEAVYIFLCVIFCGLFFLIDYWRHFKWRVGFDGTTSSRLRE